MTDFERISEEQAGLKQGTVAEYITKLNEKGVNLHSLMLFKDGRVFAETYADGFDENFRHRLYSVSKTYVSAAVGVAADEGYFSLDDKITSYFTDKTNGQPEEYLENLTVRDCLMMATPFDNTPYDHRHDDWLKDFFTEKCTHRGGSLFHYDTGATLVLDALVERTTGKHFNEYLYEKVLKYIGYDRVPECVEAPDGTKWGGSGMLCTTRQFAAFAKTWMNGGRSADGRQLIPEAYIAEATKKQIGNHEGNAHNDLRCKGYGYQTWMIRDGWAMFGMGNQLALCFPEDGVMLICTGDDQGNDFARTYIIDYLFDCVLLPLRGKTAQTAPGLTAKPGMPVPQGECYSTVQDEVSGISYNLRENHAGIEKISFIFGDGEGKMIFTSRGEEKEIAFGLGRYVPFEFPEKDYSGIRINTPLGRGYRSFAAAAWDMRDLLVIKCYAADMYFGVITVNVRFSPDGIDLHFTKTAEWFFDEYTGFFTGDKA